MRRQVIKLALTWLCLPLLVVQAALPSQLVHCLTPDGSSSLELGHLGRCMGHQHRAAHSTGHACGSSAAQYCHDSALCLRHAECRDVPLKLADARGSREFSLATPLFVEVVRLGVIDLQPCGRLQPAPAHPDYCGLRTGPTVSLHPVLRI